MGKEGWEGRRGEREEKVGMDRGIRGSDGKGDG
jgi:hypothetical protein